MFLDELKDYIEDNTSLTFGTDFFIGNLPDSVNNCVVMSQSNTDNIYQLGNELGYNVMNVVFRVRGNQTENATRTIANDLQGVLENLTVELDNYKIVRGVFETPFYQLDGTDENNNYIFVGIYQVIIEDILQ